jgi:hypothetical protein
MPWPMTDNDSVYRPQQMTRLNVSNKTLVEIYRDMFIAPFDASGFRTPCPTWRALLSRLPSPSFVKRQQIGDVNQNGARWLTLQQA